MGEAVVKERSMEDILSSIRKIISEAGNTSEFEESGVVENAATQEVPEVVSEPVSAAQMNEVSEEVRVEEPVPIPQAASDDVSGDAAAKMVASLASIADSVKAEIPAEADPVESVWDEVAEPAQATEELVAEMEPDTMIEPQEAAPSLASIAETVAEQVEVPVPPEVEQVHQKMEAELSHVEMAEATLAPVPETKAPEISSVAVETMVEEEMAFKGALMSPSSDGSVSGAFDRLKRSAMDDIDAKTEAILRPMLREWLDENLANMVERLVREEIERVARGV